MSGVYHTNKRQRTKILSRRHSAPKREASAKNWQDSKERTTRLLAEKTWESLESRINPIKEFSAQTDDRTLRWAKVGFTLSAIFVGLAGLAEAVMMAIIVWYLCR